MSDMEPLHHDSNGWWFWDETWSDRVGPFPTEAAAQAALNQYYEFLERDPEK